LKKILWPNCALMWATALCGSAVLAQTSRAAASDPNAAVPPVVYQSVFEGAAKGVETRTIDWKRANAEVGQFRRGHVDILKWEEANPSVKPAIQPAVPSSTPAAPISSGTGAAPGTNLHKH
jgi:hypothetical protein